MSIPPNDPIIRGTAELLRKASTPKVPNVSPEDRMRSILAMEAARDREPRRAPTYLAIAAVAAVSLLAAGAALRARPPAPKPTAPTPVAALPTSPVARSLGGDAFVVRNGASPVPLDTGSFVAAGDHIVSASDGRAGVSLPTGTHLLVESNSDLALTSMDAQQTFKLVAGSMRADVAKLRGNERFIVRTSDAEIEVRGTSFRVERVPSDPSCAGGNTTRVQVLEGVVAVRANGRETLVAASDTWPHCGGGNAPTAADPAAATAVKPIAPSVLAPASATPPKTVATSTSTPSELAEQNDMFSTAVASKRAGDARGAVAGFERLLAKYPNCALAEQASVERMKLLATFDPPRATAAAKAYLTRYPKGYARPEAQAILAKTP